MNVFRSRPQLPFWLLTIAAIILLILPKLIEDGMFMDAMLYTSVGKNLGNGVGTFWNPVFSESWNAGGRSTFHEQPPLVFYLLSRFFKVLGNGMYTERIYIMLTTAISALMIHRIWTIIPHASQTVKRMSWLPVLIWITFPVVMWTHQQMLCENTMELFILGAVYFICRALYSEKRIWLSMVLAGCCLFLATFSKGVPGLFPVVVVPLSWLVYRKLTVENAVVYTIIVAATPLLIYGVLLFNPEAVDSLDFYFNERLIGRVSGAPVVSDRFQVMKELITHLLVVIGLIAVVFGVVKLRKKRIAKFDKRSVLFFSAIGISGSVPLMLTLVQRGFYMTPAMPFFAMAVALILAPTLARSIDRINTKAIGYKLFSVISIALIVGGIGLTASKVGTFQRDREKLELVRLLDQKTASWTRIALDDGLRDWALECYLMRYADLSVMRNVEEADLYLSTSDQNTPFEAEPEEVGAHYLFRKP